MRPSDTLRENPGQLAAARAAAGLGVSELARRTGVSRTAVRKWEAATVPLERLEVVCAALDGAPEPPSDAGSPLEQLAALVDAEPGLTEARFQARARHLAGDLAAAEHAGVLHRSRVVVQDASGRRYSRVLVLPGAAPIEPAERPHLRGYDVEGLRHLHGWSQGGLAKRLGVTRQRVADLERVGVPDGRQEQLHRLLVAPLPQLDLATARRRTGLAQAELARRLGKQPSTVNLWERGGRSLPLAEAVRAGHVLAAAAADEDPTELAAARVVEVVARAQPDGCTASDLTRELGRGRRRGPGPAQYDDAGLKRALRRQRVHWRQTWIRSANGRWRSSMRLYPGPRRRVDDEQAMSGSALARARREAGVSQSELAAGLGTVWGTVSKWERRGRRPIPPAVTAAVHDVLEHLVANRPDPRVQARARLLAAAAADPGLPRPQLLRAAGYGRATPAALAGLEDLMRAGELHLRPTPNRAAAGGHHQGVHPGPAPRRTVAPLPGEDLRRRRLAAGLRQREVAERLGVTQTAVGYWERGVVPAVRVPAVLQVLRAA